MRHRGWLVLAGLNLVAFAAIALLSRPRAPHRLPNVVIFSICSLRADRLASLGGTSSLTPAIDALARRGVVFEHAYTQGSSSRPSHQTLFTGRYPRIPPGATHRQVPEGETTLAEVLRAHGYANAGFTGGGDVAAVWGFSRGFDVYSDDGGSQKLLDCVTHGLTWLDGTWRREQPFMLFMEASDVHPGPPQIALCPDAASLDADAQLVHRVLGTPPQGALDIYQGNYYQRPVTGKRSFTEQINELERHPERHAPQRLTEGMKRHFIAHYDAGVRKADDAFGTLMAGLASRGLQDETLVIVIGDHGWDLFEKGFFRNTVHCYDGIGRVPLVMAGPTLPRGRRVTGVAGLIDVAPTVLDYLGIAPEKDHEGHSLLAAMREAGGGTSTPAPDALPRYVVSYSDTRVHLRMGGWELVMFTDEKRVELYDQKGDPEELRDLSRVPARAEALKSMLAFFDQEQVNHALPNPVNDVMHLTDSPQVQRSVPEDVRTFMRQYGYW